MRNLILVLFISLLSVKANSQCTYVVESTDDYSASIELRPVRIIAPASCRYGYNFNVEIEYDIILSGPEAPGSMWTLQGNMGCGEFTNNFFNLPNSGGSGTVTTTGNPYNPDSDCAIATVESLECDAVSIQIQGPGISNRTVECIFAGPLPIELISFSAEKQDDEVSLNWETASETDNDYFNVLHSVNGKDWKTIDKINGAGNSTKKVAYDFTHRSPEQGVNYYRLKQVDFNGDYSYSITETVTFTNKFEQGLKVYPNPVVNNLTVEATISDVSKLSIHNIMGGVVNDWYIVSQSSNKVILNLENLAKGVYLIRYEDQAERIIVE